MKQFNVEQLKIAKPCGVGWETMTGDEKKRHCELCELSVYNIEAMTAFEVELLFTKTNGRLCGRIRRRADGTVVTKQCPKGLRDYGKRVSRITGAAMTAILAAFSFSYGQSTSNQTKNDEANTEQQDVKKTVVTGIVRDKTGAVIPGAAVQFLKEEGVGFKRTVATNVDGIFEISNLIEGVYRVSASTAGFKTMRYENVIVEKDRIRTLDFEMEPSGETVVVGVFADSLIDFDKTDISTTIYRPPQ